MNNVDTSSAINREIKQSMSNLTSLMVAFSSTLIAFLSLGVFTLTVMVAEPYNQEIGINDNNNIYLA